MPTSQLQLRNDYPLNAHRILKIVPQIQGNEEEFNQLVDDERNLVFDHPNLMFVERSIMQPPYFVIAMEDMDGTVHDLLKRRSNFLGQGMPEKMMSFILKHVLRGLSYIHSEQLLHGNLDPWSFFSTTKSPAIKLNVWAADFDIGVLRRYFYVRYVAFGLKCY